MKSIRIYAAACVLGSAYVQANGYAHEATALLIISIVAAIWEA